MRSADTEQIPRVGGELDAYEFYVWVVLFFRCDGCDTSLDCPVTEDDTEAPGGAWMRNQARRAHGLGWYVHPLGPDGGLTVFALCPDCVQTRGVIIPDATGNG
jgi:hypothetical protein